MSRRPTPAPFLHAPDGGYPGIPGGDQWRPGGGQPGGEPAKSGWTNDPAPGNGPDASPIFRKPEPTQTNAGTFELSGWWRRFGALIIDAIVLFVLLIPITLIIFAIAGVTISDDGRDNDDTATIVLVVLFFLSYIVAVMLYAPLTMSRLQGATLGKKAVGIRVVRADGQPMTFGAAAVREIAIKGLLVGIASQVTFGLAWLVNYLWPLWDSEHRAVHDMIAKTRVVRA